MFICNAQIHRAAGVLTPLSLCQVSDLVAAHAGQEQELAAQGAVQQKEHEKLREQNRKLHESLLSDNDHRLTAFKNYCTGLQQEVMDVNTIKNVFWLGFAYCLNRSNLHWIKFSYNFDNMCSVTTSNIFSENVQFFIAR